MISASVTSRSGPFSRATNCTCIVLLLAIASSSAPSWNGRGAFGLGPGSPPKTTSFDLPPARRDPRGEEKGLRDDGRRPTSRPSRRRGRGDEQACQPERSGGNPEGAGAPAQRLGPPRSTRAASKEDGQARQGGGNGRVALRRALAARPSTAWTWEPRGHLRSDQDA